MGVTAPKKYRQVLLYIPVRSLGQGQKLAKSSFFDVKSDIS